ncbi:OB-fold domain-containing protein [Rhodococcus sp. T2V]|uniref:Zn-ribbon domain-containing OB-fold protein n=1 Tax=Rhodococcus sp. T2V TaxID=3034164 RepID=UPI0023E32B3B|nr:zinc ribbon domain-containing protein [Rhodococcus sp. T2V]MDF3305336.1 OB-fold domain-containing protein [Rhodococcus sp. T2V]
MNTPMRPRPTADADSAYFWAKCSYGELYGQRCGNCQIWRWPPRRYCPACHAAQPVWEKLPGTGTIVGLVIQHRVMDPAFSDEAPLAIVHVQIDGTDGEMVLVSRLKRWEWMNASVGSRVTVVLDDTGDEPVLPTFKILHNKEEEARPHG